MRTIVRFHETLPITLYTLHFITEILFSNKKLCFSVLVVYQNVYLFYTPPRLANLRESQYPPHGEGGCDESGEQKEEWQPRHVSLIFGSAAVKHNESIQEGEREVCEQ